MIQNLKIQGLRGIREGEINGLAPLTILVGPNGCGKSTILEAAGIVCAGSDVVRAADAILAREWLGLKGLDFLLQRSGVATIEASFVPAEPFGEAMQETTHVAIKLSLGPDDSSSESPETRSILVDMEAKGTGSRRRQVQAIVDEDGCVRTAMRGVAQAPYVLCSLRFRRSCGRCAAPDHGAALL